MRLSLLFEAPANIFIDPSIKELAPKLHSDPHGDYSHSRGTFRSNLPQHPVYSDADVKLLASDKVKTDLKNILDRSKYNFNVLFFDKIFWDKYGDHEKYRHVMDKVKESQHLYLTRDLLNQPEQRDVVKGIDEYNELIDIVKKVLVDERMKELAVTDQIPGLSAIIDASLNSSINLVILQSTGDAFSPWMILHQLGEVFRSDLEYYDFYTFKKDLIKTTKLDFLPLSSVNDIIDFIQKNKNILTELLALDNKLSTSNLSNFRDAIVLDADGLKSVVDSPESERSFVTSYKSKIDSLFVSIASSIYLSLCMSKGTKKTLRNEGFFDPAELMAEFLWHTDGKGNHRLRRNPDLIRVEGKPGLALVTKHLGEEAEQLVERYYKNIELVLDSCIKKAIGTILFYPHSVYLD